MQTSNYYTFCVISLSNLKTGCFGAFISMEVLKPDVLKLDVL